MDTAAHSMRERQRVKMIVQLEKDAHELQPASYRRRDVALKKITPSTLPEQALLRPRKRPAKKRFAEIGKAELKRKFL